MNLNRQSLQTLFPNGTFKSTYNTNQTDLIIPTDNGFFYLPIKDLTSREESLITELLIKNQQSNGSNNSIWFDYLFNGKDMSTSTHQYRIIQLKIRKDSTDKKTWLEHFSKLFDCVIEAFFVDDTSAYLVEQQTAIINSTDDIKAMLLTLETEFLIKSIVYVGQFRLLSDKFVTCFYEEQNIFNQFYSSFHPNDVFSFQDVALTYLTKKAIKESSLMTHFYQSTVFDDEIIQIIKTLWSEQGNITSTAKKLYIHRNTLQYKLDKFSEQSGISLKNMTDLTLCYLLILSF